MTSVYIWTMPPLRRSQHILYSMTILCTQTNPGAGQLSIKETLSPLVLTRTVKLIGLSRYLQTVCAFKTNLYIGTNPDRASTVNKLTIRGLITNHLANLHPDTRNFSKDCLRTANTAPCLPCTGTMIWLKNNPCCRYFVRQRLLNFTAGPLWLIQTLSPRQTIFLR